MKTRFQYQDQDFSLSQLWDSIVHEGESIAHADSDMEIFIRANIFDHNSFCSALCFMILQKLSTRIMPVETLSIKINKVLSEESPILHASMADLLAFVVRDPACRRLIHPFLYFKGFHALQCYRVSHALYNLGFLDVAYYIQTRVSEVMSIDIHPAAVIGSGIMIDHGHSIVIGETAVLGNQVSILHSVTLGGTGNEFGDRHPKIGDGVLLGAGAKVLGNINVGKCSRVASGSVVLSDVPERKTVAGVPARIVGESGCSGEPSMKMDHNFFRK